MLPKFVRRKFAGVQQPLGPWILRHVVEFIVLSPAILVTFIWLKLRRKEVLIVGRFSNNISMLIAPLEPELRRRSLDPSFLKRTLVLILSTDANSQVRKMFDRVVKIYGSEARLKRRTVWWASHIFSTYKELVDDQSDPMWVSGKPTVSFSDEEERQGEEFLTQMGLKKNEFLCYSVRTESYYLARMTEGILLKPQTQRNPTEQTYLGASQKLFADGFRILRMGKDLNSGLDQNRYPEVIDYASLYRSDFLDVYLMRYCKFLYSGGTGLVTLRWLWNLPSVTGDSYLIWRNQICYDVFLLQRVWLARENRHATFTEMLLMPGYSEDKHQSRLGVQLVKNTVEEIKAACDEMNARINGTWLQSEEDEKLQGEYQDLIVKYSNKPNWNGGGRIGAQFLRDNQDLLR